MYRAERLALRLLLKVAAVAQHAIVLADMDALPGVADGGADTEVFLAELASGTRPARGGVAKKKKKQNKPRPRKKDSTRNNSTKQQPEVPPPWPEGVAAYSDAKGAGVWRPRRRSTWGEGDTVVID